MVNSDLVIGLLGEVLTLVVYLTTRDLSPLGAVFTNYIIAVLGTLSLAVLIKGFIRPERITFFSSKAERRNILVGVGILAAYLAIMPVIGFLISSFLFYSSFSLYLSDEQLTRNRLIRTFLLSAVVVGIFYFVFHQLLLVPLPEGMIFD